MLEQGVDRGVLYLNGDAVPWNGLVSVEEKETGWVESNHFFEGTRTHISQDSGTYEARITAYTYPDVFAEYDGYSDQETFRRFGYSYRTAYGDTHRIHLVYNAWVKHDSRSWTTESAGVTPSLFNWDIFGSDVEVPGGAPAARLIVEAPRDPTVLGRIETILYGSDSAPPRMPSPAEIVDLYEAATWLQIIRHPDGTYTASGPDDMVRLLADGTFEINSPSALALGDGIFVVDSY